MSSNPLKLKIKFSKGPVTETDPRPADGKDKPSKKRKAGGGHPVDKQKVGVDSVGDREAKQAKAERDLYAEAKRPKTESRLPERPKDGNEPASPKSDQHNKPRLVIK